MTRFARHERIVDNSKTFDDVTAADWFNAAIGRAYEKGVVNGCGSRFGAQVAATRAQIAAIVERFCGKVAK